MTTPVETLPPETPAEVAWDRMRLLRIRHVVVVDTDGKVEGIVSERDLGGRHGSDLRRNLTIGQLMTATVVTAGPDTMVREAANLLRGRTIGCLPIVKWKCSIGMVTVSDLLELIGRGSERPVPKSTRWTLKHRGPRRKVVNGRG
jgi:acetoin utilization protein AcuB